MNSVTPQIVVPALLSPRVNKLNALGKFLFILGRKLSNSVVGKHAVLATTIVATPAVILPLAAFISGPLSNWWALTVLSPTLTLGLPGVATYYYKSLFDHHVTQAYLDRLSANPHTTHPRDVSRPGYWALSISMNQQGEISTYYQSDIATINTSLDKCGLTLEQQHQIVKEVQASLVLAAEHYTTSQKLEGKASKDFAQAGRNELRHVSKVAKELKSLASTLAYERHQATTRQEALLAGQPATSGLASIAETFEQINQSRKQLS